MRTQKTEWVDTCDTVMWYWSADTLFQQLPMDHNMNVQYQVAGSDTLARMCEISHWFPLLASATSWSIISKKLLQNSAKVAWICSIFSKQFLKSCSLIQTFLPFLTRQVPLVKKIMQFQLNTAFCFFYYTRLNWTTFKFTTAVWCLSFSPTKLNYNRTIARWRHFTTSARILEFVVFVCKLRLLFFNFQRNWQI